MDKIIVLYGNKKGENIELLISESRCEKHIENAKIWALKNGFENLKIAIYTDNLFELPNFERRIKK